MNGNGNLLSVIAVNHNSSALLEKCFSSLFPAIGDESWEFLVVDNGSREEDVGNVLSLEGMNVRIIVNKENIGYARAVNQGMEETRGDYLLITNPDVLYKPGSVQVMLRALVELPRCGAVAPKTWWNEGMTFLLPFTELLTPYKILAKEIIRGWPRLSDLILKRWIKGTSRYWLSEKPISLKMLSGACILTTRKVLNNVGGFDETFPLYFEDTDWLLRVRKAGYYLYMVPQANIIHYYNQSAKQDMRASQDKFRESSDKYLRKHFRGQSFFVGLAERFRAVGGNNMSGTYEDMGVLTAPPLFSFEDGSKKLFLLSPVDSLIPSAGSFFEGDSFEIPRDLWDTLGAGRYFVKVLDVRSLRECRSWSWMKQESIINL